MTTEESNHIPVYFLLFSALLALVLLLSKALSARPRLNSFLSEPAMVLLVGMAVSFLVRCFFFVEQRVGEHDLGEDDAEGEDENTDLTETILSFPSQVFFMALLPPILFNSGYQLQRELFYRHIKPIVLFAALGTTVSGIVTGVTLYGVQLMGWMGDFNPTFLELLTFGALIAATDTVSVLGVLQSKRVDPRLFSLVFGESALNDAVAIVLFRSLAGLLEQGVDGSDSLLSAAGMFAFEFSMVAIGSPILGIVLAFFAALVFKYADLRQTKIVELSLYFLLMYIPFVLAEVMGLSGIVTIFFTGMSARRYIEPNVSEDTKVHAEVIFHLIAYLSETCIFLELGLSVFGLLGSFRWDFIAYAFIAALLGRALSVYPISALFNWSLKVPVTDPLLNLGADQQDDVSVGSLSSKSTQSSLKSSLSRHSRKRRKTPPSRKDKQIPVSFMHILWFAGLRGAVAYACAREFPALYGHNDEMTAATMVIVFITIVVMGGGTESLLEYLQIPMNVDEVEYMKDWRSRRKLKGAFHEYEHKYIYEAAVREHSADKEAAGDYVAPDAQSYDEIVRRSFRELEFVNYGVDQPNAEV